jgi:hypothetical protein
LRFIDDDVSAMDLMRQCQCARGQDGTNDRNGSVELPEPGQRVQYSRGTCRTCNSRRMAWRLENVDIDAPPVCSPVEPQWKATVACGGAWDLLEVLGCTFLIVQLET